MRRPFLALLVLLALATLPGLAHGVHLEADLVPPSVLVQARYEGGTPIPDATLRVYGPGAEGETFQRGYTDLEGRFAFAPTRVGTWQVVVADSEGHRASLEITIDEDFLGGSGDARQQASSRLPLARWLVGLSIIFGVTGLLLWAKARALLREREGRP